MNQRKYNHLVLLAFVVAKFLFTWWLVSPEYDLQRDEYLHLDQGRHLAWGYLSVPPATSWFAWLINALGGSVFWIRFIPTLFGALTLVVVWKAIEKLGGKLPALVLGATCILLSVLLRLNLLFQPNALDVLCWTTLYYLLIRYQQTEKPVFAYYTGLVFAIGMLNKYNIAFAALGLLPAILVTNARSLLLKKEWLVAAGIALLLISPNLLWQYQHHFPVVYHMKLLAKTQLVNVNRADFLKEQLVYFIGGLPVLLLALWSLLFHHPFRKFRFFFWSLPFTLAIFVYFKAKGYYAIGLYPIYFAFGAAYIEQTWPTGVKKHLKWAFCAIPVLFFAYMLSFAFPDKSPAYIVANPERYQKTGMLRWEDGKDHELPQDFADMLGWRELAAKTDSAYRQLHNTGRTIVVTDNYGQAGAINYYSKENIQAVSFNADYINWFQLDSPHVNLIRIKTDNDDDEDEMVVTSPYFKRSSLADSITNPYARERNTRIYVFEGTKININQRLQQEIDEHHFK